MAFARSYQVRWADVDANGHMRNTAYSEYAAHTRLAFLAQAGFPMTALQRLEIGPVLFQETVTYLRECRMQEDITVTAMLAGSSESGHKWQIRHEIKNAAGVLCCTVDVSGAWFSVRERKVAAPPAEIRAAMLTLPPVAVQKG